MALPSSGEIDAKDIYTEYYKSHTSQEVNMNTMAGLYGVSTIPNRFNNFYSKSWTVSAIEQYGTPNGTYTSSGFRSGSDSPAWEFYIIPEFVGWPYFGGVTADLDVTGNISNVRANGGNSGANASIEIEYTLNGFTWSNIASSFVNPGGGYTSQIMDVGPNVRSIGLNDSVVSNLQFRITVNLSGSSDCFIDDGTSNIGFMDLKIEVDNISGANNNIRLNTSRDVFLMSSFDFLLTNWGSFCSIG